MYDTMGVMKPSDVRSQSQRSPITLLRRQLRPIRATQVVKNPAVETGTQAVSSHKALSASKCRCAGGLGTQLALQPPEPQLALVQQYTRRSCRFCSHHLSAGGMRQ